MRPISRPKKAADSARRKTCSGAAAVGHRPVHQPGAIGEEQMLADQAQVMSRLLLREQAGNDAARHRQQRIAQSGARIARVQQQLGLLAGRIENSVAGDGAVAHEVAVEVLAHCGRELAQLGRLVAPARALQDLGIAA